MGCLSVNVTQIPPTVMAGTFNANSKINTKSSAVNNIEAIVSKGWNSANMYTLNINTDIEVSAWLVCKVGIEGIYLAVNEGLIITLDDMYLKVIKE